MPISRTAILGFATALGFLVPGHTRADQGRDTTAAPSADTILIQYKSALTALRAESNKVRAIGNLRFNYRIPDEAKDEIRKVEFQKFHDKWILKLHTAIINGNPIRNSESGLLISEDRCYRFRKGSNGSWFVRSVEQRPDVLPKEISNFEEQYIDSAFSLHGLCLDHIMASPDFTLENCGRMDSGGKECIKFTFRYRAQYALLKGWWTVSPSEGWVVQDYHFERGEPHHTTSGKVTYNILPGHLPSPREVSVTYIDGPSMRWDYNVRFDSFERNVGTLEDFTASSFHPGLEEIATASEVGPDLSLYFLGLAAAAFALSLLFGSLASRGLRRSQRPLRKEVAAPEG